MLFGLAVQVLAPPAARSSTLAARRRGPSHVLREQLGAGWMGGVKDCGGQAKAWLRLKLG